MNTSAAEASQVDVGLRAYMLGVYNYMTTALLLSGFFAFGTKMLATTTGPDGTMYYTPIGALVYGSPLAFVLMLAPLGMVFWLSARFHKMSASKVRNLFFAFAAVMGISLSSILITFEMVSVARAFFITAGAFAGLSLYGYSTKRSLSAMGSFMTIGLFGLIIGWIVNMFIGSAPLDLALSALGVIVFAGLTAWDTQKIKLMYMAGDSQAETTKKSIFGALTLYLDFINMFIMLLHLFGNRE